MTLLFYSMNQNVFFIFVRKLAKCEFGYVILLILLLYRKLWLCSLSGSYNTELNSITDNRYETARKEGAEASYKVACRFAYMQTCRQAVLCGCVSAELQW